MPVEQARSRNAVKEHVRVMELLWMSHEGYDLTLVCGKNDISIHSYLLKPRSKLLAAACEGAYKEAANKSIDLSDDKMPLVYRMCQYCYLMDYPDEKLDVVDDEEYSSLAYVSRTHTNAKMYALANKYDMVGLKEVAANKFHKALSEDFELPPIDHSNPQKLTQLVTIVSVVYGGDLKNNLRLRDHVLRVVGIYWDQLSTIPEFKTFIGENPGFAIDLVNKHRS